jgi:hypothetical protein
VNILKSIILKKRNFEKEILKKNFEKELLKKIK